MRISVGKCTHKHAREPCISLLQALWPPPRGYLPSAFIGISKPLLEATTRVCLDQIDYSQVLSGCSTRAGLVTRPWSELAHTLPACSAPLRAWSGSYVYSLVETSSRRWDGTIPCQRHSRIPFFMGTAYSLYHYGIKRLIISHVQYISFSFQDYPKIMCSCIL